MFVKFLTEAKVSDADLVATIKRDVPEYAPLQDSTIAEIINIYKKKNKDTDATAENIVKWLQEFDSFAEFVFLNSDIITTFSTSDFAEHDEKLGNAIRKVLQDWKVIDKDDIDLTGTGKKLTMHNMCSILFDNMAEVAKVPHSERTEKIPQWVYQMYNLLGKDVNPAEKELTAAKKEMEDKYAAMTDAEKAEYELYVDLLKEYNAKTKDPEITKSSFSAVEDAYHKLYESVDDKESESHKCPKCGEDPCICEDVEETEVEEVKETTDEPAPEGVTFDLSDGDEKAEEVVVKDEKVEETSPEEIAPTTSMLTSAFYGLLGNLVQSHWHLIDDLNAAITMLDSEEFASLETKDDISKILNDIINDCTIDVGMLYKAMEVASNKTSNLIADGMTRAEETID